MLNFTTLDASDGGTFEVLFGNVTGLRARGSAVVTVGGLSVRVREPSSHVTRAIMLALERNLVTEASEVVRELSVHELKGVDFNIRHPLATTSI